MKRLLGKLAGMIMLVMLFAGLISGLYLGFISYFTLHIQPRFIGVFLLIVTVVLTATVGLRVHAIMIVFGLEILPALGITAVFFQEKFGHLLDEDEEGGVRDLDLIYMSMAQKGFMSPLLGRVFTSVIGACSAAAFMFLFSFAVLQTAEALFDALVAMLMSITVMLLGLRGIGGGKKQKQSAFQFAHNFHW